MLPSPASLHRGMQTTPKGLACQLHSQPTECLADSSVKSAQGKQMCRWEIYLQGLLACQVINVVSQGLLQVFIAVARGCHCKTYKKYTTVVASLIRHLQSTQAAEAYCPSREVAVRHMQ